MNFCHLILHSIILKYDNFIDNNDNILIKKHKRIPVKYNLLRRIIII